MPPSLRHPTLLTLIAVVVACGSGASSQGASSTGTTTPGTPIAAPAGSVTGTPIATPAQAAPVASPAQATPIASPAQATPVAGPSSGSPTPTPVASPSAPGTDLSPRMREVLDAHNQRRAQHCAPPLRWSTEVAAVAQRYADQLAARGCAFDHSQGNSYGENLMRFSPAGSRSPTYVVDAWYREVAAYDYSRPTFGMDTGHFTQVVWVGSTELGCGVAICNGGETWVCNYAPAGNMMGSFPANVRPTSCR